MSVTTIFKVWQHQGPGYVAIARKQVNPNAPKGSKNHSGIWEEKSFQWPDDLPNIKEYIIEGHKKEYDLYWCPSVMQSKRRVKESITNMSVLYADLDEVNPNNLSDELKPSVAWESSPNRYAGIWYLPQIMPSDEAIKYNKSLTYMVDADKGGWDLTQVLRIPGTKNHKYQDAPKGKLLWENNNVIDVNNIELLSEDLQITTELPEDYDNNPNNLLSLVSQVKDKIKSRTLSLLIATDEDVMLFDRSEKLWELECQLIEQGVSPQKVLQLIACSAWNKYRGRNDEVLRLQSEIDKVLSHTAVKPVNKTNEPNRSWSSYSDLLGSTLEEPEWLIEGVWQKSSHGIIAGEPKTYKSMICTDMAVSVASGKPFMGKYKVKTQGPVMFIQEENSPWLVKDRTLKVANARGALNGFARMNDNILEAEMPDDLPLFFLNNAGFDFTSQEDRDFLEESIKDIKPVMIIFDPLYLMLGSVDENSSKEVRPILAWLLNIRYTYHTAIIIVHHWNKSGKSERGGQRMLGSGLFHGWVESAMYTRVLDEQKHQIEIEREFRSFPKPDNLKIMFNFGNPGDLKYDVRLGAEVVTEPDSDVLLDLLHTINGTAEELSKLINCSLKETKTRLTNLVKLNKVSLKGNVYTIKEDK